MSLTTRTLAALLLAMPGLLMAQERSPAKGRSGQPAAPQAAATERGASQARPIPGGHGPAWFDIWDLGGRPGEANAAKLEELLERIHQALEIADAKSGQVVPHATLYFRDSPEPWYFRRPFFIGRNKLEIRGAGRGLTILKGVNGFHGPLLLVGVTRTPTNPEALNKRYGRKPIQLTADHWVDLHGRMDQSAASAQGKRWALRTKDDAHVVLWSSPFSSHGDLWKSVKALTVDFAIDGGDGKKSPTGYLFGMGSQEAGPAPWHVDAPSPNHYRFQFRTHGPDGKPSALRSVEFQSGDATGLQRLAVQVDLENGKSQAFVNGRQVATKHFPDAEAFRPAKGLGFAANEWRPFHIANWGEMSWWRFTPPVDLTLCGLSLTEGLRYRDGGAGTPWSRADGSKIDDNTTYFAGFHKGCIATLPMEDGPQRAADGRLVRWKEGGSWDHGYGLFVSTFVQGAGNCWVYEPTIRDLSVKLFDSKGYGDAISIGAALRVKLEHIEAAGGFRGIGSYHAGASYFHHYRDIVASGSDAGIYGFFQLLTIDGLHGGSPWRTGMRFAGCSVTARDLWWDETRTADSIISLHNSVYGGQYEFTNLNQDSEETPAPTTALILCENHQATYTRLKVRDVKFGTVGPNAVVFDLRSAGTPQQGYWRAICDVDGMMIWGKNTKLYKKEGAWEVRIRDVQRPESRMGPEPDVVDLMPAAGEGSGHAASPASGSRPPR